MSSLVELPAKSSPSSSTCGATPSIWGRASNRRAARSASSLSWEARTIVTPDVPGARGVGQDHRLDAVGLEPLERPGLGGLDGLGGRLPERLGAGGGAAQQQAGGQDQGADTAVAQEMKTLHDDLP